MKKNLLVIICILILVVSFSSCFRHHRHYTSVTISDSGDEYELNASYDRDKTSRIQRLLDRELNVDIGRTGSNVYVDANITLKDRTTFYIRALPGKLRINFNKRENSGDSWEKIQDVCEDIKEALGERN